MAWHVRACAISQGIMAKNDRMDARVISQYARNTEALRETRPVSRALEELRELMRARDELIELEANHAGHEGDPAVLAGHAAMRTKLCGEQKNKLKKPSAHGSSRTGKCASATRSASKSKESGK